jgi:vitamin B12/bleomycin/antimicrobial peptide transport system ATP-binding/permease protein
VTIPGFLVVAAVGYAVLASGSMAIIGRRYIQASEAKSQREAELRYALTRLRENGESIALIAGEDEEKAGLDLALSSVMRRWRELCRQYMRTTVVAQMSFVIAPVFPVLLSAPKFLAGTMTRGQVMQAASAL